MGMLGKPRRLRLSVRAWGRVLCEGEEERESSSQPDKKRFWAGVVAIVTSWRFQL